ncbi:MAG: hypothetical protein ACI8RD_003953 [Bacillariaceae sp.]|jgi:hypothetical protein
MADAISGGELNDPTIGVSWSTKSLFCLMVVMLALIVIEMKVLNIPSP